MNSLKTRKPYRLLAALCLLLPALPATAGGLIETDLDAFLDASFGADSADITNHWWTLPAGTNVLYFAEEGDECAWNLVETLPLTTDAFVGPYAGTSARIVLDREWVDEECEYDTFADVWANADVAEITYDWYAQDTAGNIWYMGEDTIDDEGSDEGSFVAGCDGAEAGIVVLGAPAKGDRYQQEHLEDEAEDWGKVLNFVGMGGLTCMKTKEWTPLEPGNIEHKFYCSDGEVGALARIEQLKGQTVIVEPIDYDVAAPPAPAAPPSAIPEC